MTLPSSVVGLASSAPSSGSGSLPAGGQGSAAAWVALLPHLRSAIAVGLVVALVVSCMVALLLMARARRWHHRALRSGRRGDVTRDTLHPLVADSHELAGRPLDAAPAASSPLANAEALRLLEGTPVTVAGADGEFRTLAEEIPGVGRVEWDAQTLRAFACQPDVLYRLAFHRWRLQQGTLSEFDLASGARARRASGEHAEQSRHAAPVTRHLAPNSEGLRAQTPGHHSTEAEE